MTEKSWHAFSIEEICEKLETREMGLTLEEAARRLKEYGRNVLPEEKPYSKSRLFLSQFNTPLMYIILAATAIAFFLNKYTDTIFILIVVFINTFFGFYQENKANQAIRALKKLARINTLIFRDGGEREINSEELVPGDIIFLKSGYKVPADCRIIESSGLKINESALTGEWLAVEKMPGKLEEQTIIAERRNTAFLGSNIEEGWGKAIVVGTGPNTEFGRIAALLRETKEHKTPLQKKILTLSKFIGAFILFVISVIVIIGYFTEKYFSEVFTASLALAVSAIPEGLLPLITVALVLGMRRILKQKGIVRKIIATETLGGVTAICTDKTGTLTEGKMRVSHILTGERELNNDDGGGFGKIKNINGLESHISALKVAVLAGDAFIENPEAELAEWIVRGRPTEQALLLAGAEAGLEKQKLEKQFPLLDRINFNPNLKYSASLHKVSEELDILYVLGAPEILITASSGIDADGVKESFGTEYADHLIKKFEDLASRGLRVVACAERRVSQKETYGKKINELVKDLTLVGFIALKDPLRKDAKEVIATTRKAGIRTMIVTGDHKLTASTIARELRFEFDDKNVYEGADLEKMSNGELSEAVKTAVIFARVSPVHKLKIVEALRLNGEVVAMFGDGVNDAPALKTADIGVVVGSGTDVAKEAADLVLLDDNFRILVKAIEQGRIVFENIRKLFIYMIADDFSEIFLFFAAMAMGLPIPLLPAQILWINIVEDSFPAAALTTEEETKGIMNAKPRRPDESIMNAPAKKWMAAIFFITGIAAFVSFYVIFNVTGDIDKTRTMIFALMALDSLLFAYNLRSLRKTIFRRDIFDNHYVNGAVIIGILLLGLGVYFPPVQAILHTQALNLIEWCVIFGVAVLEILLIGIFKWKIFGAKIFGR